MAGINRITEKQLRSIKPGATLTDGGGLYLQTSKKGNARSWVFRKMIRGELFAVGLGGYPLVSLEDARKSAERIRAHVNAGGSMDDARDSQAILLRPNGAPIFIEYAEVWMRKHLAESSTKTTQAWQNTIRHHARALHNVPIDKITVQMVGDKALAPIWLKNPETARRLQTRLWRIFGSARVAGLIQSNPAEWKNCLDLYMPKQKKTVEHLRAMEYAEVPDFYAALENEKSMGALCLQTLILTGLRVGEARRLRWEWIDFDAMTLTIPEEIMKVSDNGDHRIPITPELWRVLDKVRRSLSITQELPALIAAARKKPQNFYPVFYSVYNRQKDEQNISETAVRSALQTVDYERYTTIHGLRTPFRVWLQTQGGLQYEACEAALHHRIRDTTVRSYLRTDWLEERRPAMLAWSQYVSAGVKKPSRKVEAVEAEVETDLAEAAY